jgi:uncharacterized protein YjbI with pentapeptide repeats
MCRDFSSIRSKPSLDVAGAALPLPCRETQIAFLEMMGEALRRLYREQSTTRRPPHILANYRGGTLMAIHDHVAQLNKGVPAWNAWREENPTTRPDLSEANLSEANLFKANLSKADCSRADLSQADLREANLGEAVLFKANLSNADLSGAYLFGAILTEAILFKANLSGGALLWGATLSGANLSGANLRNGKLYAANLHGAVLFEADLRGADLQSASLLGTDLRGADLTGCLIYGVSAWGLKLDSTTKQQNLVITHTVEPAITVDNIEVAQLVYLLLHNHKLRDVIDTITSKTVLILGRFTDERKAVLDALREELRKRDYLPILFDFEKPRSRDTDETITLLARMARFVIADISDAKAVLQELRAIVPDLPSVPVQPIILALQEEPGMFDFYRNRPSFLTAHRYTDHEQLLADLGDKVIRPAELKVLELRNPRSP